MIDTLSDLAFLGVVPVAVWALVELIRIRRALGRPISTRRLR